MSYEYLDELQDIVKEKPPIYEEVVQKTIQSKVLMEINTNKARYVYFRITDNLFIKLFHILITIISNPIIICLYLIFVIIKKPWIYSLLYTKYIIVYDIILYFVVIGILVVIENYIVRKIILMHSLKDVILYHKLYSKGIIGIKYLI